jgi:hypothetical protein
MIEIVPTLSQISLAKEEAKKIGVLNNSILSGKGNVYGVLGEILVADYIKADRSNTYDFDLVRSGRTVDVKTKQCTSKPNLNYYCTVADYNTSQDCEVYGFVRILKDFSKAWILGGVLKEDFYNKAIFYKKGDPDPSSHIGFKFQADCYNIEIKHLKPFKLKNEKR